MKTVLDPGSEAAIEFLTSLFKSGLDYSAMNTVLPVIDGIKFGEQPLVCWFLII
jgi:hypothetical protein